MQFRATTPYLRVLLRQLEKYRPTAYRDGKGVWTAGVGHTGADVRPGETYSDLRIETWLDADIGSAEATIYRFVPAAVIDQIPPESFDALVSFVFNVGAQAFRDPGSGAKTNFARALEAARFTEVDDRMRDWNKATIDGRLVTVGGLTQRRAVESALWNKGFNEWHAAPVAVPVAAAPSPALAPEPPAIRPAMQPVVPVPPAIEDEATIQPDAPRPRGVGSVGSALGAVSATVGAVASVAPDTLTASGQQIRALSDSIPVLGVIGSILIIIGVGLLIWRNVRHHIEQGA